MGVHQTLKNCTQCGHAAELHVEVCPKCKKIFDPSQSQLPESAAAIDESLTPAEIIASMQEKKATGEEHVHITQMSQGQVDAISLERAEFNRRWREMSGKKNK
jgi:predicted ATP-dependent serine protease